MSDAAGASPNLSQAAQHSPLVSVIIPAFNTAGFIEAALHSVFTQTFTDHEVIVVNDGSADTVQLEAAIQPYAARITYLKQENRGPSAARNLAIRQAHGEWLAFLDSDDAWLPQYLSEQLTLLRNDPALDMVYCDARLEGETWLSGKTFMHFYPSAGAVSFESILVEKTQVITSGTVVRRTRVMEAGLFDEEMRYAEDHDLWLRISHAGGKIAYHGNVLLRHQVRSGSQGSSPGKLLHGEIKSLTKLNHDLDLNPAQRDLLATRLHRIQAEAASIEGKAFLLAGNVGKAYEFLHRAQAFAPNPKLRVALISLRIAPRLTVLTARWWARRKLQNRPVHP
jgi:glycosyltransferase involved in cell wall biosynthesis